MAASSNPGGNSNQEGAGKANPNNKSNNSGSVAVAGNGADNSVGLQALKHNTGLAVEWSIQEQAKLEDCLAKYAGEPNISKYVKIATLLPDKTVRDVAIRCRWMSKKESGKRRKPEEQNATKKIKDKKEKTVDPSVKPTVPLVARSTVPMYNQQMLLAESDDGITYEEIGGLTGQLLQQNAHVFNKITANLHSYQSHKMTKLDMIISDLGPEEHKGLMKKLQKDESVGMSKKVYKEMDREMEKIASQEEPSQQQRASNVLTYKEEPSDELIEIGLNMG